MSAAKPQPVSAASDSDLPEGWICTTLGNVVAPSKEKIEPADCPKAPYLSLEHIEGHTGQIVGHGRGSDVRSTKAVFRAGDVLYGKLRPYLNKVAMPTFDGVCSTDILVFPKNPTIASRFLAWFLMRTETVEFANHNSTGVQLPRVGWGSLASIEFALPPLAEQKRIVAKVEELLARVNAARDRLARVPVILKRFRQAVLAAACSGRLTADWRLRNENGNAAHSLLQDILRNRPKRIAAQGIAKVDAPREPDESQIMDVPEQWAIASFDQLSCMVTSGSRGWAKFYSDSGPIFVRAQDINTDQLRLDDVAHVQPPGGAEGRRTRVQTFDLLVTITGANVTKSAMIPFDIGEAYVSQHVALIRPVEPSTSPFLLLWIVSPEHGRAKLLADAYGAGKPGLNLDNIKEISVALPPIEEQREIVRRVEALFKLASAIERRVAAATARADRLTQAILAKAFRGELVPSEAELARRESRPYEPASTLLARLRAEREVSK